MAGELKHASVGPELTQVEWESINSHTLANGVAGDMLYYDGVNIKRIPIGASGDVMTMVAGLPAWASSSAGLTGPLRLADGTVGAPAYSWADDTDTGIYKRVAGNSATFGVAAAGGLVVEFSNSGLALASTMRLGWYKAVLDTGYDIILNRDGVGILGMRNGTQTQTINVYMQDQGSGVINYERMSITGVTGTGGNITMQTNGVGAANLSLTLTPAGTGNIILAGPTSVTGQILAADGTTGAPSYSFASAPTSGLFFASSTLLIGISNGARIGITTSNVRLVSGQIFGWVSSSTDPTQSLDLGLARDGASIFAQRLTATAQKWRVYNTFTTVTTVGEWAEFDWVTSLNTLLITTRAGTATGVVRPMIIGPSTATQTNIAGANLTLVAGSALSGVAIGGIITLTPGLGSGAANGNVVISRGGLVISAAIAGALEVGANGATNPVLRVNAATGSVATGLQITGAAAAGGVALAPISSGANEDLILSGIGTGKVRANASYGAITTDADGATVTFDMAVTNLHTVVLGGNRTLAVSNVSVGQTFYLYLVQDGTGTRVPTWFTTIKWAGGVAPTLTTALNKGDLFTFLCTSAGNYVGLVVGQNI